MYAKLNVLGRLGLRLQPISIACLHSLAPSLQSIEDGYEMHVSGQGWPREGQREVVQCVGSRSAVFRDLLHLQLDVDAKSKTIFLRTD
jgi:hypothetical protein